MTQFLFVIEGVEVDQYAAGPLLLFKLRITAPASLEPIESLLLSAQILIESPSPASEWGESQRPRFERPPAAGAAMSWTTTTALVPAFQRSTKLDLAAPCTLYFNAAAMRYFGGKQCPEIPLRFLFQGTVFRISSRGKFGQTLESSRFEGRAKFALPGGVWRRMMDIYYPHGAWLQLGPETLARLTDYQAQGRFSTLDGAVDDLLQQADAPAVAG